MGELGRIAGAARRGFHRRFHRRFLGAVAAAGMGAGFAGAAQAEQVIQLLDQRYNFVVKTTLFPDLTLATGEIRLATSGADYRIEIDAKALVAGTPINWRGAFETAGVMSARELKPKLFKRSSVRAPGRTNERRTDATVDWTKGEAPVTEVVRTPSAPAKDLAGTVDVSKAGALVDPLTFMVAMLERVRKTDGQDCSSVQNTWDGERLAVIETSTIETVTAARIDCRVVYRAILGLSERNRWRVKESATTRTIRFRKIAGRWRPEYLKINAQLVGGLRTTFTTTLTPVVATGG